MGTRGYRVVRFRGRYYRFFNHWDSYPSNFGSGIVNGIPTNPEAYRTWLAKQRATASEWAAALEKFLHVEKALVIANEGCDDQLSSEVTSEVSEGALLHWSYYVGADVEELPLPSYMPAFNDVVIEWVYVIDLDREIFSVDHGAHLPLGNLPRGGWIDALDKTGNGYRLVLPDLLPDNSITSLVVSSDPPDVRLIRLYEESDVEIVTPAGINGFDPTQRHEPLFCARIFQMFQRTQQRVLAHLLLGWKPDDFAFREIAFTILCLVSGRHNISLVEDSHIADDDAHGCAYLTSSTDPKEEPEFVAHMGVGAHLNDNAAGSAPQSPMYWFEGVLVHLVSQLDKPDAIPQSVSRVAQRAREDCPWQPVDAVLISIAHMVLVRVFPDGKVQHTQPLPLFIFRDQPSQHPRERFTPSELEKMVRRKERATEKRMARIEKNDPDAIECEDNDSQESDSECDEEEEEEPGSISFDLPDAIDLPQTYDDITKTEPSFFALALLFDAASKRASKPLPAALTQQQQQQQKSLPVEIHRLILKNIDDVETIGACMAVSSEFREMICSLRSSTSSSTSSIIEGGYTLSPNQATKSYTHAAHELWNDEQPPFHRPEHIRRWTSLKATEPSLMPGFRVRAVELATTTTTEGSSSSEERDVTIDRVVRCPGRGNQLLERIRKRGSGAFGKIWRVVVGSVRSRDRRSVLMDVLLAFRDVEVVEGR